MPPRRVREIRKITLDDLNGLLISADREHLGDLYGSLEAARERYDMLEQSGQYRRRGGQLPPPIWWFTEPDVPTDLIIEHEALMELGVQDEKGDTDWTAAIDADEAIKVRQWAWLAETGRLRPEDRQALEKMHRGVSGAGGP